MAAFPALAPARRRYRTRDTARRSHERTRFRLAEQRYGATLELGYELLGQTEAALLRGHYMGQRGGLGGFSLSAQAWAGHSDQLDLVPPWMWWVWLEPPEEEQRSGGLVNLTCRLRSVLRQVGA